MKWGLNLFGPFRLVTPNGNVFSTRSSRVKVLLSLLAVQPSFQLPRLTLAEALFDAEELPTSPNLRVLLTRAISSLSQVSDTPLLHATSDRVEIREESVVVDLLKFDQFIRQGRQSLDQLESAKAWRGALLIATQPVLSDIDEPFFVEIRDRIHSEVLEALYGLAKGLITDDDRALILQRLSAFKQGGFYDAMGVERLMGIYEALGMKEELIEVFTEFESHLDYEFGEKPPEAMLEGFTSALKRLDIPAPKTVGFPPARPTFTVGRNASLDHLQKCLAEGSFTRLITLTGQSGIGKSHLLRELFWKLRADGTTGYFDLETTPLEVANKLIRDRKCETVFLDHVTPELRTNVAKIIETFQNTRFICASSSRVGLAEERLVPLRPLELGTIEEPGSATEMLIQCMAMVHGTQASAKASPDAYRLALLCEGIPLAMEIAGKLSAAIGIKATLNNLKQNLRGLTSDSGSSHRQASLRSAIEASFQNLSDESGQLVALLSRTGNRCHIDQLLTGSNALPIHLEEAIHAGLVVCDAKEPYVHVRSSTATFVNRLADAASLARWRAFCVASRSWFLRLGGQLPLDLSVSGTLPFAMNMVVNLIEQEMEVEAFHLLGSLRPWMGSCILPADQLKLAESALRNGSCCDDATHAEAVLSLGAAYFHLGSFQDMLATVRAGIESVSASLLPSDLRCQLTMQVALAQRCLGDLDGAIQMYRQALHERDEEVADPTVVKCYYNIGTLLESQEDLEAALESQETASSHFSIETDPRVESLVNTSIGRLHYRLGDCVSASLILEATLAHAKDRADRRSIAEVLQNLGPVYWERKMHLRAALSEILGSLIMLEFGYTPEYRLLTKSSFVTICDSLFELGFEDLATSTRTLIDRLGDAELYAPDRLVFESVVRRTYANPGFIKFGMASESEVQGHLMSCLKALRKVSEALDANRDLLKLAPVATFDEVAAILPAATRSVRSATP